MAKSKYYIFSTLAGDNVYANHRPGGADLPVQDGDGVLIKGGAGVIDKRLITPQGVMTVVTADELDYLQGNEVFKVHKANGFIVVSEKPADPEAVASADMTERDPGAQLVPGDFAPGEEPVVASAPEPPTPKKDRA